MKKYYAFLMVWLTLCAPLLSSAKDESNTMTWLNFGVMRQGKEVKGYYAFYKVDKHDRKNNNYLVQLYDNNFNDVNKFDLVKPMYYSLMEATYNGDAFLFLFMNGKEKKEELITYDVKGKQIKTVSSEKYDPKEYAAAISSTYTSKADGNVAIQAVPGKGFLKIEVTHSKKEKTFGYAVNMYDKDLKKQWTILPGEDKHKFENLQPIYYDYKYMLSIVMGKDKFAGSDYTYDLMAMDIENGKTLFKANLKDDRYYVIPSGAFYDEANQRFILLGEYRDKEEKITGGKSNGIAMLSFDATGKPLESKYLTWTKDLSKFIPISSSGKIEDGGFLAFQKMFATSDGKIFAIAEQYKKDASALGIASTIMNRGGGNISMINIKLMDLMVFEFKSDFTLNAVSSFDKGDHHIELPSQLGLYPLPSICILLKYWGYFNYNFMTMSADQKTFSINYDIWGKGKDPIKIGNLVYTPEGKLVESTVELKDKPLKYAALPAKWGYLGLMEVIKQKKYNTVSTRVEKLDY